jgi:hypothetical protein
MSEMALVEEAIANRRPIRFRYIRNGKTTEIRTGNPHALYLNRLKDGTENIYVDLWQTEGASDSGKPLPSWRKCIATGVTLVEILSDKGSFEIREDYNPASYGFPIRKV